MMRDLLLAKKEFLFYNNLPLEIVAIIGGIYGLVDLGNTTINMMSEMVGTIMVYHLEGKDNLNIIFD